MMFKIVAFVALFTMTIATTDPDISQLFDTFLKEIVDRKQLADGSYQTTYFNIPHRQATGLVEPFLFRSRANSTQLTVSNVRRSKPVNRETRRSFVSDGGDFDYTVLATAVTMDIKVNNLAGNLTTFVGNNERGAYLLNGNLQNLVMNVTMQLENGLIPERDGIPTIVDMVVGGSDEERSTVESVSARIVGDLVTTLFYNAFRAIANGDAGRALKDAVVNSLERQ